MNDSNQRTLGGYRSWLNRARRTTTALQYHGTATKFVEFCGKPVNDIDMIDITTFLDKLDTQYAATSVSTYANQLKTFLRFIDKDSLAIRMPVQKHPIVNPEEEIKSIPWIPEDVIQLLIDSASNARNMAILQMGYHFAFRVNEVPLLKRDWVNNKERILKIYRLKTSYPWMDLPFDHTDTDINDTYQSLQGYLLTERQDKISSLFVANIYHNNRNFINGQWSESIDWHTIEQIFHKTMKKAAATGGRKAREIQKLIDKKVGFHMLRHSKATDIIIHQYNHGGRLSILVVAKWLGHKNINNSMRYVHIAAKHLGKKDLGEVL